MTTLKVARKITSQIAPEPSHSQLQSRCQVRHSPLKSSSLAPNEFPHEMTNDRDHYSTLGILPEAEHVVVVAAFRALASRYHPDKWDGDKDLANARMAELNVAYGVLSDPARRSQYDKTRQKSTGKFHAEEESQDQAFGFALDELEDKWRIATRIYPELEDSRRRLNKTAHRLAFAFVTIILETKQFKEHRLIADRLQQEFLERYFGSNPKIIAFAKELISKGLKKAIIDLNKYVEVFGVHIDSTLVINKIKDDYNLNDSSTKVDRDSAEVRRKQYAAREKTHPNQEVKQKMAEQAELDQAKRSLKKSIISTRSVSKAKIMMNQNGFNVFESSGFLFFGMTTFTVENRKTGDRKVFEHETAFINWVLENYCTDN